MLEERLVSLGVPCARVELPWANHGFDVSLHGPSGQLATYAVEKFLASVLK